MSSPQDGVSIIITSYNYGRFIGRAIESASAQTVPGLEIVVVDNASTDDSWDVIQSAARADPRVRAFRNETNIGMSANHTRGLELSTRPRILFLSADDYLFPGHLARVVATHGEHPEVDYVFTAYVHVDEHDQLIRFLGHVGHPRGSYYGGRNDFADLLTHDCYACTATTLFHRDEMLEAGNPQEIISGDYDHYLRLASDGACFAFIDRAGVAIRIHKDEYTGVARYVATGRQLLDQVAILERHLTPKNQSLIAGREQGIANMLVAKIANLQHYPETATVVLAEAQARIDAIIDYLNRSRTTYLSTPLDDHPRMSVVFVTSDDLPETLYTLASLTDQTYTDWELVLVTNAVEDVTALLLDRARTLDVKVLHHSAPRNRAVSLNDGLTLAGGEIVTYAFPGVEWSRDHLAQLARRFSAEKIDALVTSADYVVLCSEPGTRAALTLRREAKFFGSPIAKTSIGIGEGVPLAAFAHRRSVLDRFGRFGEGLVHLVDFEFINRLYARVATGIDEAHSVVIRERDDQPSSILRDPAGYIRTLEALYAANDLPQIADRRAAHLRTVRAALNRYVVGEGPREASHFTAIARGVPG